MVIDTIDRDKFKGKWLADQTQVRDREETRFALLAKLTLNIRCLAKLVGVRVVVGALGGGWAACDFGEDVEEGGGNCLFDSGSIDVGGGNHPCAVEVVGEVVSMLSRTPKGGLRTVLVKGQPEGGGSFTVDPQGNSLISDALLPDQSWPGQPVAVGSSRICCRDGRGAGG